MAKEYNIFSEADFMDMVGKFSHHFRQRKEKSLPFQKIKIISKRWVKPKTSAQHRTYWRCIGELKKAFIKNGHDCNEEDCHEFIKKHSGFTRELCGIMITKSIKDSSDDATSPELNRLIDFIQRFSAENLNTVIEVGNDIYRGE